MYLLGDIHASTKPVLKFIDNEDEKYCIQLGDFGFVFSNTASSTEDYVLDYFSKKLCEKNKYLFTILGNHECWPRYFQMKTEMIHGAKCWVIRDHIYAIQPGEIIDLENKTFLCIGGANSIDKDWRIQYEETGQKIWWAKEEISKEDIENAIKNLDKVDRKVDFILTHSAPEFFSYKLYESPYSTTSEDRLDEILNISEYSYWYCGHVHCSATITSGPKSVTSLDIDEVMIV